MFKVEWLFVVYSQCASSSMVYWLLALPVQFSNPCEWCHSRVQVVERAPLPPGSEGALRGGWAPLALVSDGSLFSSAAKGPLALAGSSPMPVPSVCLALEEDRRLNSDS